MVVEPKEFPVFLKPITNLYGAGLSSSLISSPQEYEKKKHLSGHFWTEYLQGDHLSHDLIVIDGEVVFNLTFKGEKLGQGMFDYWETIETPVSTAYVSSWVKKNLSDYTGTVNLETIDSKIIECHLRMGDIDRLGNIQLMQSIIDIYAGKSWTFQERLPHLYIFALWGDWNVDYRIEKSTAEEIGKNLTCYQIDKPDLYFQNPPGGVRLAITCSHNKEDALKARYKLYEHFSPKPRKPKITY